MLSFCGKGLAHDFLQDAGVVCLGGKKSGGAAVGSVGKKCRQEVLVRSSKK